MKLLVLGYMAIGLAMLAWMISDREVREDLRTWSRPYLTGYMVFVVLGWPLLLIEGPEERR